MEEILLLNTKQLQYPQRYPIRFSVNPIVKTDYQVLRLSCIRFSVYRVAGFAFKRFCVYRVNRNTSAFSWTNKRKTQRSPTFCYYCRVIKYCGFLSAITICICFSKLKVYQYYYNFNLINSLWLHCFYLDRTSADRAKSTFQLKYLQMKINVCFDVLTMSPQSKYLPV